MEEYLTIAEVMSILKISRLHLNNLTKKGKIPAYKIGRSVRYKRREIEEALIPIEETEIKRSDEQ